MLYVIAPLPKKLMMDNEPNYTIEIINEGYSNVNIQDGYNPSSTEAVLEAVVTNGTHTVSLSGNDTACNDSKNNPSMHIVAIQL